MKYLSAIIIMVPFVLLVTQILQDYTSVFNFYEDITVYANIQMVAIALVGFVLAYNTLSIKRIEAEENEINFILEQVIGSTIKFSIINNSKASYSIEEIILHPSIVNKYENLKFEFLKDKRCVGWFAEYKDLNLFQKVKHFFLFKIFRQGLKLKPNKLNFEKRGFEIGQSIISRHNETKEFMLEIYLAGPDETLVDKSKLAHELSKCSILCYKFGNPKLGLKKHLNIT